MPPFTLTTIEIPATLTEAIVEEWGESALRRWAIEALVLSALGDNLVSTGEAAEMLGLGYFQTLALVKERGIPLKITAEEFEQDQADLREIASRRRAE